MCLQDVEMGEAADSDLHQSFHTFHKRLYYWGHGKKENHVVLMHTHVHVHTCTSILPGSVRGIITELSLSATLFQES